MSAWSLPQLFENIHNDIDHRLSTVRRSVAHPGSKGDGSESVWLNLLKTYLPQRYQCDSAFIVDSEGHFSEQQDVVIFDRQYSPFVFHYENQKIIPAESVYAVFEVKQTLNAANVAYAQRKIESVRTLVRTSLPIPHAGGPETVDSHCGRHTGARERLAPGIREALARQAPGKYRKRLVKLWVRGESGFLFLYQ
ncbi:DUF6602 domain-containing protein [Teredinibacter turnerae]|uniref:DUF6602 domain-containing protein n=1 Tax=Teredinibacter turnerae TaxID=2426 RepID=UPI000A5360A5|nr:DUF6602 domain-containing protein [Teredinibacter turnerae]